MGEKRKWEGEGKRGSEERKRGEVGGGDRGDVGGKERRESEILRQEGKVRGNMKTRNGRDEGRGERKEEGGGEEI